MAKIKLIVIKKYKIFLLKLILILTKIADNKARARTPENTSEFTNQVVPNNSWKFIIFLVSSIIKPAPKKNICHGKVVKKFRIDVFFEKFFWRFLKIKTPIKEKLSVSI